MITQNTEGYNTVIYSMSLVAQIHEPTMIISQNEVGNYKAVNKEWEISPCKYIYTAIIMQG